jgi:hypothetical protein
MKNFIIGFIIGSILATTITAYAAARIVWVDGGGLEFGTASNPINITNV